MLLREDQLVAHLGLQQRADARRAIGPRAFLLGDDGDHCLDVVVLLDELLQTGVQLDQLHDERMGEDDFAHQTGVSDNLGKERTAYPLHHESVLIE